MSRSCIVLGSTGLIGSVVRTAFEAEGYEVVAVHSADYDEHTGARADVLVNCNGNTYRYKAATNPRWDFEASVATVARSLFDFGVECYIHISTVEVYNEKGDPGSTREDAVIEPQDLGVYAFHKWIAERLVERHVGRSAILRCGTVVGPALKKGPVYDILNRQPIHMTPDSRLSLVDAATIARAALAAADGRLTDHLLNVTGTGSVSLGELGRLAGVPLCFAADGRSTTHRYDINTERLRRVLPVASSRSIAAEFIRAWYATRGRA